MVATVVLLTAGSTQAAAAAVPALFETGWSNGKEPLDHHRVIKATCPNNTFIERWVVGVGDVDADNVDDCNSGRRIPLLSIVSIQGRCSDGTALPAIAGRNQASEKYDLNRHPSLSSPSGYSCLELEGYYYNLCRGGSWFMNFLGVGQELANGKAGSFLQFNCPPNSGPTEYVAVGYAGYSGAVADAINLMMAPVAVPTSNLTNATTTATPGSSAAVPSPSPETAGTAATAATPGAPPSKPSTGVMIGIAASCLVGLSAIVATAYRSWRWALDKKHVAGRNSDSLLPIA